MDIPLAVDAPRRLVTSSSLITLRELGGVIGTGLSVSPDGRYLAFELHQADISKNDYRVAWFVAPTTRESVPVNVGGGGEATLFRYKLRGTQVDGSWIPGEAKWSPDSRGIAYRKRANAETQIWWSSRDGREQKQLTHNAADIGSFYWGRDGSRLYFETDADRKELQETEEHRYRHGHVFDYDKDWSTIGARPLYPPYLSTGGKARVWVLDIATRLERLATTDELLEYGELKQTAQVLKSAPKARQITRTAEQRAVAWVQPDDPEKHGRAPPMTLYASRESDGRNPIRCPAIECTGTFDLSRLLNNGVYWNSTEDEVLFVRKEGVGYSRRSLYGWRIGEERARKILSTHEWISDCSIVENRALCFHQTPTYPRTIIAIDLVDGSMETLVDPNPEFQNLIIGDVELFEWQNEHGRETFGYLVKPPDYIVGKRYPLVIVGYRARRALRGGTGDEYPVHVLAVNGFVVLVYEKLVPHDAESVHSDMIEIARARWGPDLFDVRMPLSSFESAIRILVDRGLVDPGSVALTGFSNGAAHVNYAIIHSDLFAAAITSGSQYGPNNRVLIGASGQFARKYLRVVGLGGPYPGPHAFLFPHMSLALNAERVNTPLLVNSSDSEHPEALEEIVALIENGKPVEMVVYPDEMHVKWQPQHRLSIYKRNIDWLNFWLQGVENPSQDNFQQYARWRRLADLNMKRDPESASAEVEN